MEIRRIRCGIANAWLLKENDRSVLVDTGVPGSGKKIYPQIKDDNVGLIILTHGHADHVGGTAYLASLLEVPVMMHPLDVVLLANNLARELKCRTFKGQILGTLSEMSAKRQKVDPFRLTDLLKESQSLEPYGIGASIITLPGHTEGSVGVLTKERDLIAGDAIMHMGKVSPPLIYEDGEVADATIEKLRGLGLRQIYPGHGKPFVAADYF